MKTTKLKKVIVSGLVEDYTCESTLNSKFVNKLSGLKELKLSIFTNITFSDYHDNFEYLYSNRFMSIHSKVLK